MSLDATAVLLFLFGTGLISILNEWPGSRREPPSLGCVSRLCVARGDRDRIYM